MKATAKLSTATVAAIGAWTAKVVGVGNSKVKAVDLLIADGVTSEMLGSREAKYHTDLHDSVKISVVLGFTATVQALLKKDAKGLSDAQKSDKRYWSMQIGSKVKDLRNALAKREALAEESDGAGTRSASFDARLKKDLSAWIAKVEKLEGSSFSVVDMLKHLKGASALIK